MSNNTISQYKLLHSKKDYGTTSKGFFPLITMFLADLKPNSILDYGCGQSALYQKVHACNFDTYHRYDPAIEDLYGLAFLPDAYTV